jgi:hypothetical protein
MNHEDHEDHEEPKPVAKWRMRLTSRLSAEAESAMTETIGSAIAVRRELGPGYLESIYRKAMYIELDSRGISYDSERPVVVKYREVDIPYLRTTGLRGGLLINCRVPVLRQGIRRIVV